jgi:Flp pilus assembly protein TadB
MRFAIFTSLLAFIFLVAAVHLPPAGGLLLMIPIFLAATTLAKWWQSSRQRLRRAADAESNFERARRIN